MNNALIALYGKSPPKQLAHLDHLIAGLSPRLNDLSYKPASEHYYPPLKTPHWVANAGKPFGS